MINKDNYQAYFLDYIEGNLPPKETDSLLSFLEENPELKSEFSDYEEITISPQQIKFPKEKIYQVDYVNDTITKDNFEKFTVAFLEGELSENKTEEFSYFVSESVDLKNELSLFEQTKLKPDLRIIYPKKSNLKRKVSVLPLFYRVSMAAAILLFFYFSFFNSNTIIEEFPNETLSLEKNKEKESFTPRTNTSASNTVNSNHGNTNTSNLSSNGKLPDSRINLIDVKPISSKQILFAEKENSYQLKKVKQSINVNTIPAANEFSPSADFLSPKEFIATLFKRNVLKISDDSPELTFADVLTGVTNEKVSFPTKGNQRVISISTKNFSFEKKIPN